MVSYLHKKFDKKTKNKAQSCFYLLKNPCAHHAGVFRAALGENDKALWKKPKMCYNLDKSILTGEEK